MSHGATSCWAAATLWHADLHSAALCPYLAGMMVSRCPSPCRRYDIQEPVDVYQKFATAAGFGQAKEIAGDGNFMKVLAFQVM